MLTLADESARLVMAGEDLLTIGDLNDREIRADILSNDAVSIVAGTRARIDDWGGDRVLDAEVRTIEPSAFTRVSALGIEEQRVPIVLDLLTPAEARQGLGDRFRVLVTLVTWESPNVLQVPQSALFRAGHDWAVFLDQDGRAVQRSVRLGRMSDDWAEIRAGVVEGDRVLVYPGASIRDGTRITPRAGVETDN